MQIIQKSFRLKPLAFYEQHLSIVSAVLPNKLTTKEIQVLAAFMAADSKLTEDYRFNPVVRSKVMAKLKLSPGGLGNHLSSLIKKGYLDRNSISKNIKIKSHLLPEEEVQFYQLKVIKNVDTEE